MQKPTRLSLPLVFLGASLLLACNQPCDDASACLTLHILDVPSAVHRFEISLSVPSGGVRSIRRSTHQNDSGYKTNVHIGIDTLSVGRGLLPLGTVIGVIGLEGSGGKRVGVVAHDFCLAPSDDVAGLQLSRTSDAAGALRTSTLAPPCSERSFSGACDLDRKPCTVDSDCASGGCADCTRDNPSCPKYPGEACSTDADCRQGTCPAVATAEEINNVCLLPCRQHEECMSQVCDGARCLPPTCTDAVQNGDEAGVDCGGTQGCTPCPQAEPTCADGMQNGGEIGVDCGGPCRTLCGSTTACRSDSDCPEPRRCVRLGDRMPFGSCGT